MSRCWYDFEIESDLSSKLFQEMSWRDWNLKTATCWLWLGLWYTVACEIESALFYCGENKALQGSLSDSPLGYFCYLVSLALLMRHSSRIALIAPISVHLKFEKFRPSKKKKRKKIKQLNKIGFMLLILFTQLCTSLTYSNLSPFHLWLHLNTVYGSPSAAWN